MVGLSSNHLIHPLQEDWPIYVDFLITKQMNSKVSSNNKNHTEHAPHLTFQETDVLFMFGNLQWNSAKLNKFANF